MIFKLVYEENGAYIDAFGKRCTLLIGVNFIDTPNGLNYGCVTFDTEREAEVYYGITLFMDNIKD